METAASKQSGTRQWGEAPFALAPAALRAVAGERPVPEYVCEKVGESLRLRSLDSRFWDRDVTLDKKEIGRLVRWLGGLLADHRSAAIAEAGFPPIPLLALCLSPNTHRVFEKAFGKKPIACDQLDVGAILDLPNVGSKRALEFLAALDVVFDDAYRKPPPGVPPVGERRRRQRMPREIRSFFRVLAAWASGERRETAIGGSLPAPHPDWPPELVQLWKRVGGCSAHDLAGSLAKRYGVPRLIAHAFKDSDPRHRLVLRARVFATDSPTSLDSLARVLDCSQAGIKSMQHEAMSYLGRLQGESYKPVKLRAQSVRQQLGTAIPHDDPLVRQTLDWAVADFSDREMREFGRSLLFWLAGPYRLQDDWFVASADLAIRSRQALVRLRNAGGVIGDDAVRQALARLGILPQFRVQWIRRLGEFAEVPDGLMWADVAATTVLPKVG